MMTLAVKAIGGLLVTLVIMGAVLFLTAWTFSYWQAWTFLAVFGGSGLVITAYLMRYDPKLLERRVDGGPNSEKTASQRVVMSLASLGFLSILVVSALDYRQHWSAVPDHIAIMGDMLILIGWLGISAVFKENSFASATIEIAADQQVVSTGPYAVVRHPMYACALLYLLGIPLALALWWGLIAVVLMVPVLIWRLLDEEQFLANNLPGYAEYRNNVKYRLLPHVW